MASNDKKRTAALAKKDNEQRTVISVADLRRELAARGAERSESLSDLDDDTIVEELKSSQKVIYGADDRQDVFLLTQQADINDAASVCALFRNTAVTDNGNGTSTLTVQNFGTTSNLCAGERFRDQPIGAFCSGFLVAPDIIATAGHCADVNDVTTIRFVFGFRMTNATTAQTTIANGEVYSGVAIVGRQLVNNGADWALVRVDRNVTGHPIARIRRTGTIPNNQAVHVIGHPVGLPMKFAGGANVRNNQPADFFVANLDTYGGNSGSPVFNSATREVEGILVRGETDFVQQGGCTVSLVCPTTGCRGEDVTRTTVFQNMVPQQLVPPVTSIKKFRDDQIVVVVKQLRDRHVIKKIRDDIPIKGPRDPMPPIPPLIPFNPFGGGPLLPFSLRTGHHAKTPEEGLSAGQPNAHAMLEGVDQQLLDLQAALAQARATGAQAEAEAARLEAVIASLMSMVEAVIGGSEGSGN